VLTFFPPEATGRRRGSGRPNARRSRRWSSWRRTRSGPCPRCRRERKHPPDLFDNRSEQHLLRRSARGQRRDAPQRGLLLDPPRLLIYEARRSVRTNVLSTTPSSSAGATRAGWMPRAAGGACSARPATSRASGTRRARATCAST
jgi:hypothetical protein